MPDTPEQSVSTITTNLQNGLPGDALAALYEELDQNHHSFRQASTSNEDFFNNYVGYYLKVEEHLKQQGILPDLAIQWTQAEDNRFKQELWDDGVITKDEIEDILKRQDLTSENTPSAFDRMMLEALLKQFDQVDTKKDGALTRNEVRAESDKDKVATLTERLLQSQNGESLFHALDVANAKGKPPDGIIDKEDLEAFLKNAEQDPKKGGAYTPQNIALVKELLKSWDNPKGPYYEQLMLMRGFTRNENGTFKPPSAYSDRITTSRIAEAAGVATTYRDNSSVTSPEDKLGVALAVARKRK
ncbi:MAG TPA: hypothetical protein V6D17_21355 [Candidatus Obscuribacterales bacterium]